MAYLRTDVLLLSDVFENFRATCMNYYGLDPPNYITIPGFAWDAMLKQTDIKLELIHDPEILQIMEQHKRGGLCFVGSKRYVKANNHYIRNFDETLPENYLLYLDANNLYGWAMSEALPYKDIVFDNDVTLEDILNTADDAETGYIVKCDIHFPHRIHEKLKQYPPCPENLATDKDWLSDYQLKLAKDNHVRVGSCKKLTPHLFDHKDYCIHYINLKFIHELGAVIKIHKVVSFKQKKWLAPYIDFNTEKRKGARNEFEKDFFKLMNNSVFGKTMENVKNRMSLNLTTDNDMAIKWFSDMRFKGAKEIDGLYLVEQYQAEIEMNKPIYVGTSILDLSKVCMMDFHYNVIEENFKDRYNLIYSDIDSMVYEIFDNDIYKWMKENSKHFDLSESSKEWLKDSTNKKVIGKFKDETNSYPIEEFVALNPKAYSFTHQQYIDKEGNQHDKVKKLKGVSKTVV